MNINIQENLLFEDWQKKRNDFVPDGVVNPNIYCKGLFPHNIVFIMKDTNSYDRDLREFLKNGGTAKTWNNIVRWSHAIRNINAEAKWEKYKAITDIFRKTKLQSTCVINLKKTPGEGSTDYNELHRIATEDQDLIFQQYCLYNPDITICCGTGDLFHNIIQKFEPSVKWKETSRGMWYFECGKPKKHYIFSHYHPQARMKASFLLYSILDAVKEVVA